MAEVAGSSPVRSTESVFICKELLMRIEVYFNNGDDAATPWHVALHDGKAITQIYNQFRNPLDAIQYALDTVAAKVELPVVWPAWLKGVLA